MSNPHTEMISRSMRLVGQAAQAFEGRWTMRALKRIDADLYTAFTDQQDRWADARFLGTPEQVEMQAGGMIRGYAAITKAMVESGEADDAYMLGQSGDVMVAIGTRQASAFRVLELQHEDRPVRVVWLTPDECATLFASTEGFKAIAAIKQAFPGAEIVNCREMQPEETGT